MPRRPDMPPLRRATSPATRSSSSRPGWSAPSARRRCPTRSPGDRRRRRRPRRPHGPAEGVGAGRISLPHQLRVGQGRPARRAAARRSSSTGASSTARSGSAGRWSGSSPRTPTTTSRPGRASRSSAPGPRRRAGRSDSRGELDAALAEVEERFGDGEVIPAPALGRLSCCAREIGRVLAGPGRPPARPLPLPPRGRRLADRAARLRKRRQAAAGGWCRPKGEP